MKNADKLQLVHFHLATARTADPMSNVQLVLVRTDRIILGQLPDNTQLSASFHGWFDMACFIACDGRFVSERHRLLRACRR